MIRWKTNRSQNRIPGNSLSGELKDLLSGRLVQLCLLLTASVQVAAVVGENRAVPIEGGTALLAPVLVQPGGESVSTLWSRQAVERQARELAQKYRLEGYRVSPELAQSITDAAVEQGIDLDIAFGLVRAESSFRNTATSPVGAVGLTQLMPSTARWVQPGVSRTALRDPQTNLKIGFKYLRYLLEKYDGNEDLALLAYNRGPGTVDRELKRGRDPNNGYASFVRGEDDHGHKLFTE